MVILSKKKRVSGIITQWKLKDNGRKKILDRIANKLLFECSQLPKRKKNLLVTKTEGFLLSPEDVTDSIIGEPSLLINRENNQISVEHGTTSFRTEEELLPVLQKISAVLAYKTIGQHRKLSGVIGNNKNNA